MHRVFCSFNDGEYKALETKAKHNQHGDIVKKSMLVFALSVNYYEHSESFPKRIVADGFNSTNAAVAGIAGIGHMLTGTGIILLLVCLKKRIV